MLRYILLFIFIFSTSYGLNYKFTNPIDMPNTYVAMHNECYIQVDRDSLVVYKDDIAIYHKSFQNCTKIEKSDLDPFRIKRYYDIDKVDTILFYTKLDLLDENNRNIAEIIVSKEKLSIISGKKTKEIEFSQPKSDKLLDSDVELNIEWSSYFGGSADDVLLKIAKNSDGDLITSGNTKSSSINGKLPIVSQRGNTDIMLMTLNEYGEIKWLTLIGSSNADYMYGLVVDKDDNIWLTGEARAGDFYIKNAIYDKHSGGTADGVICKFSKAGDVLFSTYIGGSSYDAVTDIAYDKYNDRVCCVGRTASGNFPITDDGTNKLAPSEYETPLFIIDNDTFSLVFSTLFGPINDDNFNRMLGDFVKVDKNGDIVVVGYTNSAGLQLGSNNKYGTSLSGGYDSFIAKFDSAGKLKWSRYIGAKSNDYASCFTIDNSNNIILNLTTNSSSIECVGNSTALKQSKNVGLDNYIAKFNADGKLIWGGYFGGNGNEGNDFDGTSIIRSDIAVSPTNEIFFTFYTRSTDLKVDNNSLYNKGFGDNDIFILALDSNSNYLNSTYLGGSSSDTPSGLLLHNGQVYLTGFTSSNNFPIVNKNTKYFGGSSDGFIVCFNTNIIIHTPPEITDVQIGECSYKVEYKIYDSNQKPGFLPLNIYHKENCNISTVQGFNSEGKFTRLTVTVEKIDNSKNAYYKFEVINFANKSIIIEDSLLAGSENYVRFDPSDIFDFGEQSIYRGENCKNIMIYNDGPSDFTLNEVYFKDNINFSFPLSQLPLIVPANSSREFTICSSPMRLIKFAIQDTLIVISPCINLSLPVSIVYNLPELSSDTKCVVPISIASNADESFSTQSLVSNKSVLNLEMKKAEDFEISIYNTLSLQMNNLKIAKSTNNIEIDFDNLANGMYFIYIHNAQQQKIVRLLLMR